MTSTQQRSNDMGQPIGPSVPDWTPRPVPVGVALEGRVTRLEKLDPAVHAESLWRAYSSDSEGRLWTYMGSGPFDSRAALEAWLTLHATNSELVNYVLISRESGEALGIGSFLRIDPVMGTLEIGHLCFSPTIARTTISTEAHYLLMRHVFDGLGYRRYEWKCDSLNAPSKRAAERLGFRFEGVHRQARVYKGRNRDTAWFSILDSEWPVLRRALETWLAQENFDADGKQINRLDLAGVNA